MYLRFLVNLFNIHVMYVGPKITEKIFTIWINGDNFLHREMLLNNETSISIHSSMKVTMIFRWEIKFYCQPPTPNATLISYQLSYFSLMIISLLNFLRPKCWHPKNMFIILMLIVGKFPSIRTYLVSSDVNIQKSVFKKKVRVVYEGSKLRTKLIWDDNRMPY